LEECAKAIPAMPAIAPPHFPKNAVKSCVNGYFSGAVLNPRRMRRLPRTIPFLALALALWGCSVNDLLLEPKEAQETQASDPVDPRRNGDLAEEIAVTNAQGRRLVGWLFASPGDRGTVLVAGGNGMGIAHTYAYNRFLLGHGFRVLVFSYQGFDDNEGKADIASLPGDTEAFHAAMRGRFPDEPVAFLGESIGAIAGFCDGAAGDFSALALEGLIDPKSVAGTIIDSHFPSPLSDVMSFAVGPMSVLYSAAVPDALSAASCSTRLRGAEVLFLHQRRDPVASFATVEHLAQLRPRHSTIVELPPPPSHAHLSLGNNAAGQAQVVAFLRGNLAKASVATRTDAARLSASSPRPPAPLE
jgi:hypothetical protein